MPSRVSIIQVDAFTSEPFRGNPAGVCLLRDEAGAEWMQAVAAEMNLSETAFPLRRADGEFSLRWFTPAVEVNLCGHATLATAHVLWEERVVLPDQEIVFHTRSGRLAATREGEWIRLDFPADPLEACPAVAGLAEALGCQRAGALGRRSTESLSGRPANAQGCSPLTVYRGKGGYYFVELPSAESVRTLRPDCGRLRAGGWDAVVVTARGEGGGCDFVSRFFAPGFGIDEDPVTGSSHCTLGPYWAERLGKTELVGHQISKRGGIVKVRVRGDQVDLLGQAVTVLRGEMVA